MASKESADNSPELHNFVDDATKGYFLLALLMDWMPSPTATDPARCWWRCWLSRCLARVISYTDFSTHSTSYSCTRRCYFQIAANTVGDVSVAFRIGISELPQMALHLD